MKSIITVILRRADGFRYAEIYEGAIENAALMLRRKWKRVLEFSITGEVEHGSPLSSLLGELGKCVRATKLTIGTPFPPKMNMDELKCALRSMTSLETLVVLKSGAWVLDTPSLLQALSVKPGIRVFHATGAQENFFQFYLNDVLSPSGESGLEELHLGTSCVALKDVRGLTKNLSCNQTLRLLHLDECMIEWKALQKILLALSCNSKVESFQLSKCTSMNSWVCTALKKFVERSTSLESLVLVHLNPVDGLFRPLFEALSVNRSVIYLDISNNIMDMHSRIAMVQYLPQAASLEHLILKNTQFPVSKGLLRSLARSSLRTFDFPDVGRLGYKYLDELLAECPNLESFGGAREGSLVLQRNRWNNEMRDSGLAKLLLRLHLRNVGTKKRFIE